MGDEQPERSRLIGINHVALEVGDLDEALALYGRIFEFELRGMSRGMAFIDIGDQFLAIAEGRSQGPDDGRHFGIVCEDRDVVARAAKREGLKLIKTPSRLRLRRPLGNRFQPLTYADVQFERPPAVKRKLGIEGLEKSEAAIAELREAGLTD